VDKDFPGDINISFNHLYKELVEALSQCYEPAELVNLAKVYFEDRFGIKAENFERKSTKLEFVQFNEDLLRLANFEPVQYVVGKSYFFEHFFKVTPAVLIPRPETEELVALSIERIAALNHQKPLVVLDVGTGSGCIAISLEKKLNYIRMIGIDQSRDALEIAKTNAADLQADIYFIEMDFLDNSQWKALPEFHFIVSNPPYIAESESQHLSPGVFRFEPGQALFVPDSDPLVFYRKIFEFSKQKLVKGGGILAEISEFQSERIMQLCKEFDDFDCVIHPDLQGKPRILQAVKRID